VCSADQKELAVKLFLVFLPLVGLTALAAEPKQACSAPEHRQFDFWIGHWRVSEKGKPAGDNSIERVANGCGLVESWRGQQGFRGTSLSFYDAALGQWRQLWIGSDAVSLDLVGGLNADGVMELRSRNSSTSGTTPQQRITWRKLEHNRVQQRWQRRAAGAADWVVVFDGIYERVPTLAIY
jgi:hypothetical protein